MTNILKATPAVQCAMGIGLNVTEVILSAEARIWILRLFNDVMLGRTNSPLLDRTERGLVGYYTRRKSVRKTSPILRSRQEPLTGRTHAEAKRLLNGLLAHRIRGNQPTKSV